MAIAVETCSGFNGLHHYLGEWLSIATGRHLCIAVALHVTHSLNFSSETLFSSVPSNLRFSLYRPSLAIDTTSYGPVGDLDPSTTHTSSPTWYKGSCGNYRHEDGPQDERIIYGLPGLHCRIA